MSFSDNNTPQAGLFIQISPMLVAANTTRKADHEAKRDPCGADNQRRKQMELENNAQLEKRKRSC
jgi:hypothetical protein